MTKKELIEKLENIPDDFEVTMEYEYPSGYTEYSQDVRTVEDVDVLHSCKQVTLS